jgi:hypothetical protein
MVVVLGVHTLRGGDEKGMVNKLILKKCKILK